MNDLFFRIAIILLLIFTSCKNNHSNHNTIDLKNQDSIILVKPIQIDSQKKPVQKNYSYKYDPERNARIKKDSINLIKITDVEVTTLEKENRRFASNGDDLGESCEKWLLYKKDIEVILRNCVPISGPEWHYLYSVWPCDYLGKVNIDDQYFLYRINAGSFLRIITSDTSFLFGCPDKKLKKYFLEDVWDPESEK